MWLLAKALSNASAKIIATFFMVLFLIMLGILFFPGAYNGVNDFSNWIANLDFIRNPDFGEQGVAVTRVFINEATIFGIVTTLIARIVVELLFFGSGALWRLVNPKSDEAITGQTRGKSQQYYTEQ